MEIQQPGPHLDHMMRQTRAHHVQLSDMADMKANMMLTVASLIVPLSIQFLDNPRFQWAALIMIGFCVLTVVLAAYAVMPKISSRPNPKRHVDTTHPSFNLFFFGSFLQMSYADYASAMEDLMNDHQAAYEMQVREVYVLGQYLAYKKYRYVRLAYLSFITGVVLSAVLYVARAFG